MADGQEPQENGQPTPEPESTPTPPEPEPQKTFDAEYVKGLRAEAAKHRSELRELQKQFAALQAEKESREKAELEQQGEFKTLAEKAQAEATKLRQELEQREKALMAERRNNLVIGIASRLNAIDPADPNFTIAAQGVDASEANAAEQIEEIIQAMTQTKSYLFKQAAAPQGQPQRANPLTPFNPSTPTGPIKETDEARRARLYGGSSQIFDPETAAQRGGGVIWPQKTLDKQG